MQGPQIHYHVGQVADPSADPQPQHHLHRQQLENEIVELQSKVQGDNARVYALGCGACLVFVCLPVYAMAGSSGVQIGSIVGGALLLLCVLGGIYCCFGRQQPQ